jgi:ABC-type antimicrobial peptide transport system permease subunit
MSRITEGSVGAIRSELAEVAPDIPLYAARSMDEVIGRSLASRRLNLWLLAIFAGVALMLATSGLYGVLAYAVTQRTQEMGIRMALGADRSRIVGMMLRQGLQLAAVGIGLGALGALATTRVLSAMLFGVGERDPVTFAGVALLLGAVAVVASWLPARRAAGVDPVVALRSE